MSAFRFVALFGLGLVGLVGLVGRPREAKPLAHSSTALVTPTGCSQSQLYDARYLASTDRMQAGDSSSEPTEAECSLGSLLDFYQVHLSDIRTRIELSSQAHELAELAELTDELDVLADLLELQASSCPNLVAPLELIGVSIKSIGRPI